MADDLSQADLVQMAAVQAAEDCPEEGDTQACEAGAGVIQRPPDGQVVEVRPEDGPDFLLDLLNIDPNQVTVLLIDINGDGQLDLVLQFEPRTPGGEVSQLWFDISNELHAGSSLQIGDVQIGLGTLFNEAQVIAAEQAEPVSLLTAAGEGPLGGGANVYNDNLGPAPDLLFGQGPILGVIGGTA